MQKLKSFTFAISVGIAALGLTTSSAYAAVILNVTGGQLTGAQNVDVNGTLFDVTFLDGTCVALFDGCDAPTDFDFVTQATADAAAQALLDQVFFGTVFDTDPELTNGCENVLACSASVPWLLSAAAGGSVTSVTAINFDPAFSTDFTGSLSVLTVGDLTSFDGNVYALFNLSAPGGNGIPTPIPEPSTLLLFGVGLAGLAGIARRRRLR